MAGAWPACAEWEPSRLCAIGLAGASGRRLRPHAGEEPESGATMRYAALDLKHAGSVGPFDAGAESVYPCDQ